jgi:hypothetical protein
MPITILPPGLNGPTGPGMTAIWSSDIQGPLQPGYTWEVEIYPPAPSEQLRQRWVFPAIQTGAIFTLGIQDDQLANSPGQSDMTHGMPARMVVRLKDPAGLVFDQGSQNIIWDTQTGLPFLLTKVTTGTTTGGFTEADRVQLTSIQQASYSALPLTAPIPGVVQIGLDAILKGPPVDLLAESEAFLLSGRASINRPSGATGVYAYGCRWRIESAPAGLGKLDGQVVEYEQRIIQLVVIKERLGGGQYASQVDNSHLASGEMQWSIPFPVRVDFDVLPGVVIRFVWLLLLQ